MGANHFILLTGACPQSGIFDAYLPARNFWKNAIVRTGNSSASVLLNCYESSIVLQCMTSLL
ncbi:hypothetical protein HX037_05245 [Ignatzschineria indica]|uniref:hypothetical protein n=1 Tax=Ignatzschineria indica TaxID=472583 RepID=UPI0025781979|nr:hypothetical protein [Ignatzschineria indica]MDM1545288.1 hypothetical protein [Ignatzschineria indica]